MTADGQTYFHNPSTGATQWDPPLTAAGGGIGEEMVVQVAAGKFHSVALTASGALWTWGKGDSGQLGHGGKEHLAVPRVVSGIGAVMGVACGGFHSLVTTADNMDELPEACPVAEAEDMGPVAVAEDMGPVAVAEDVGPVAVAVDVGPVAEAVDVGPEGRVLAFGSNGEYEEEDSDGEELDEPVFDVDGRLGLGAGVEEALIPTLVDGIVIGREGEEGKEGKEGKE